MKQPTIKNIYLRVSIDMSLRYNLPPILFINAYKEDRKYKLTEPWEKTDFTIGIYKIKALSREDAYEKIFKIIPFFKRVMQQIYDSYIVKHLNQTRCLEYLLKINNVNYLKEKIIIMTNAILSESGSNPPFILALKDYIAIY